MGLIESLGDGLAYAGSVVEKPGRAVRGVLAGKRREALAALPFSDSLGLTDEHDRTSGRDLLDHLGITDKVDRGWGAWGAGLAADTLTDPLSLLGAGAAYKAAPTVAKGLQAGAKSLSGLDLLDVLKGKRGTTPARPAAPAAGTSPVRSVVAIDGGLDNLFGESYAGHLERAGDPTHGAKVPGSLNFGGDLDDEAPDFNARFLRTNIGDIGYTRVDHPSRIESEAASRLFPGIVDEGDPVRRIIGTKLDHKHRGKGLGQALYLDMMGQHPEHWFYNSQASEQAAHAADALERKGLIEHYRFPGEGEQPHVGRITDAGLEMLSHPDLIKSLRKGFGFPEPLPLPPRTTPPSAVRLLPASLLAALGAGSVANPFSQN